MQYVTGAEVSNSSGCIFCDHLAAGDDEASHILFRGEAVFILLNAFPYNTGHLMVAPIRHVGDLVALTPEERSELNEVTFTAVEAIKDAMSPEGFNIGMNLGSAGGAGIPDHLHVHVVPRWSGDTNFMTTIGQAKVLPEMLAETDRKLRPLFTD